MPPVLLTPYEEINVDSGEQKNSMYNIYSYEIFGVFKFKLFI
jgi:hypothetical protein